MPTTKSRTTDVARWTPVVRIRGRSMQPTLDCGQVILTRPARWGVAVGDVVVLRTDADRHYVKRIVAGPGDVVELEAGRVYVNDRSQGAGRRVHGVRGVRGARGARGARVQTWHVPDGHYFVIGDNLDESDDSRAWKEPFVARSRISGVALRRWSSRSSR